MIIKRADKEGNAVKRIESLDVAKGIGIFLVLSAHAMDKHSYIWNFITLFHMPLFYMISGYLFKKRTPFELFLSKTCSLYIPYVCILGTVYVIQCLFQTQPFSLEKFFKLFVLLYMPDITGAAWFMAVLFYSEIIWGYAYILFRS